MSQRTPRSAARPLAGWLGTALLASTAAAQQPQTHERSPSEPVTNGPQPAVTGLSPAQEDALHVRATSGGLAAGATSAIRAGFGASRDGDVVWGLGPDYKARFSTGGFELHVALGDLVEHNRWISFRFDGVRRDGAATTLGPGPAEPELNGDTVVYDHGGGLLETYEVLREGIEQSFVFDARPEGTGDLIVSGVFDTNLPRPIEGVASDRLDFALDGVGGVRIEKVLGIDAAGETAEGWMRLSGDRFELGLPAAFVDGAAYPLVLDPIIGADFIVSSSFDESDPDVSYNESTNTWLVVWERQFSGTDIDIRAQRLTSTGSLTGGVIAVESNIGDFTINPAVGNTNNLGGWCVVWQEATSIFGAADIQARGVSGSGVVSSTILTVDSGTASAFTPDVSDSTTDARFLVVWDESGGGIRGRVISLNSSFEPLLILFGSPIISISTDSDDNAPAVTKSGSAFAQWCVVWERFFATPSPGDHDLVARMVSFSSALLTSEEVLSTVGPDEENPDIDGDAADFVVVYDKEGVFGDGDEDAFARTLTYDGAFLNWGSEEAIDADLNDIEEEVHVAFTGESYVAIYQDQFSSTNEYDIYAVELDAVDAEACTAFPEFIGPGFDDGNFCQVASTYTQATAGGDEVMIVFETTDPDTFDGDIYAARFESGGDIVDLGGECGSGLGPAAFASCAVTGNDDFQFGLRDAPAFTSAFLVLSLGRLDIPCGSCVLVPDFTTGTVISTGTTDFLGNEVFVIGIDSDPDLIGLGLYVQWALIGGTSACSALGADFSNALLVTIE